MLQEKAAERKLDLAATPVHATNARYIALLQSLWRQPYDVQAPCLWAIEVSYGLGWQVWGTASCLRVSCTPGHGPVLA